MKDINRYSQISRFYSLIIDNFNDNTNSLVKIERVDFLPVFRVSKINRNNNSVHEKFFLDKKDSVDYFSVLMGEKLELF